MRAAKSSKPHRPTGLGFVVIGRNEGLRLSCCLESLKQIGAPVVYADSASMDHSPATARKAGAMTVELNPDRPLNAARGRNAGLAALRTKYPGLEFVQFIDGDCELQAQWTETALEFLRAHPRAAVACGLRFEAHPHASIYNRIVNEEWKTPIGKAQSCGGDAMMRLASLDEIGLFDPTLIAGEEAELCSRFRGHGWEIWRLDAPMTRHDAAMMRLSQWTRRADRSGYGYAQAWLRTRGGDRLYASQLRSAVFWTALVPLMALIGALLTRQPAILLAVPLLYFLQSARIAARRGLFSMWSWRYAALMVIAKFPEFLGALRGFLARGRPPPATPVAAPAS
ncbi:MAG TPA: glycosyltransferase family A protein [Sphingomicrobium sp.]|nr:glycosyltransferase family A protein [Sphingomicrobium sp.]